MVYIGSDHGGFALKLEIKAYLAQKGIEVVDFGCESPVSVDYPDFAVPVARAVLSDEGSLGILICGTGIGISIAANKVSGIRAALCHDTFSARMARAHNDAQILCMGGRVIGTGLALDTVDAFLCGSFEGDRHRRRVDKITAIENR
jgi:ribose 5-phosphate isomerase B